MKQKELLNGNLIISKKLYNFLYTVLCVVVLIGLTICMLTTVSYNFSDQGCDCVNGKEWIGLIVSGFTIMFVGRILFKNNYT